MQGQRIGYVRVSTLAQNPERHLEQVPVDRVYMDTAPGKDTTRPALAALLTCVREGDTAVVHRMDRLARNLDDLWRLVQSLTQRGVRITFLKAHLTCTGGGHADGAAHAVGHGRLRGVRAGVAAGTAVRGHDAGHAARAEEGAGS